MYLKRYGKEVNNIFELNGNNENDITKAISYTLFKSKNLLVLLLDKILPDINYNLDEVFIDYQTIQDNGITDIEIYQIGLFDIIIEAKKDFKLPTHNQLQMYADDLNKKDFIYKYIYSLSDASCELALNEQDQFIDGIAINHLKYKDIFDLINLVIPKAKKEEKQVLNDLLIYLKGVINMKNEHSNEVFIVPIKGDSIIEHDKNKQYHCPVGGNFPKEAPNYIGFRHHGKLQYINYVKFVEYYKEDDKLMFKFKLGKDIVPSKTMKIGAKIRDTHYMCDIDLLLTSDTLMDAIEKNKKRYEKK